LEYESRREKGVRHWVLRAMFAVGVLAVAEIATCQEGVTGEQPEPQHQATPQNMTPEQRAASLRTFLGLGPEPDKAAAARGAPLFQQNCAFCHGPQARGATGPGLITSDAVLDDDHGEHLLPFLKKGRPQKGMPGFPTMSDGQLKDISEFIHLQVEAVANRGTYHVLNIVVGNAAMGKAYVAAHCMACHSSEAFSHIATHFRSPDQLQRGWIWPWSPAGSEDNSLAITATVKTPGGASISGRVTQVSDFRITLVDAAGQTRVIERDHGMEVEIKDPLAAHQEMIMTLTNEAMHDVTAYLETLK
jgi:cytochrome c oxidase cbb3-type subunit 3